MAAGWLVGASARGAAAAVSTLLAATTAYYGMDSVLRQETPAVYWNEMLRWWSTSVVLGPALGVVGASIGRPGVIGLLAGLTLPVGATVETNWPTGDPRIATSAINCARVIVVWVGAGVVIARFSQARS